METGSEEEQKDPTAMTREDGIRSQERDHALVRLDEKEVKARMIDAFDRFVRQGFEVHLIGVELRGAFVYKLLLTEDGGDAIPVTDVQSIANELRLDIFLERGQGLVMYARW